MSFASLDPTGEYGRLAARFQAGDKTVGVEMLEKGVSIFRGIMIGMFCVVFFASLVAIVSGGYLLVAADNENLTSDWKSRARGLGGFNVSIMAILWAISALAIWAMVHYEKQMKSVVHHMVMGGSINVRSLNQHLSMGAPTSDPPTHLASNGVALPPTANTMTTLHDPPMQITSNVVALPPTANATTARQRQEPPPSAGFNFD